jgi:SAM-dependent methyltransferase
MSELEGEARLIQAVPTDAETLLIVGSGTGRIGLAIKAFAPYRKVFGIEPIAALTAETASYFDQLFVLDPNTADPQLQDRSLDAIIIGHIFPYLHDPQDVLRRYQRFLKANGVVLALVPNVRHHRTLSSLAIGQFPQSDPDRLCEVPRLYSRAVLQRLFLDTGFAPDLVSHVTHAPPAGTLSGLQSLFGKSRALSQRDVIELSASEFVFRLKPLTEAADTPTGSANTPITFVVCVSNDDVLRANLLASPDLGVGTIHQVILIHKCPSAADGLNFGLAQAQHEIVVAIHQDVYLPRGWCRRFIRQWNEAINQFGRIGVAGLYGVMGCSTQARRAGCVIDRTRLLWESEQLPVTADSLDELLLALPRDTTIRFDPRLGFHMYGTDACLTAHKHGLANVVLYAPCLHNSASETLPPEFAKSVAIFADKWRNELPIVTPCVKIRSDGTFSEWQSPTV